MWGNAAGTMGSGRGLSWGDHARLFLYSLFTRRDMYNLQSGGKGDRGKVHVNGLSYHIFGNFHRYKFFMKQAKISVLKISQFLFSRSANLRPMG